MRARAELDAGDIGAADKFIELSLQSLRQTDLTAISEAHAALGVIRAAQGRDQEAEVALRRGLDVIAGTEYFHIKVLSGLALAQFLASRDRRSEARALAHEYGELVRGLGLHQWDRSVEKLDQALAGAQP